MSRALKTEIPGPDWRIHAHDLREKGWEGIYAGLPTPLRLVVDVGFGRGEFVGELARAQPDVAFLGVEYSSKRVLKLARRVARTELRNLRLLEMPAELLLRDWLADASVETFWVNFPDPWPKKRHHRRRLFQRETLHLLARRLAPGGALYVATDHEEYAEWIDERLRAEPLLENLYAPEPFRRAVEGRPPTAYELEWRAEGRRFHFFAYRRVEPRPGAGG